MNREPVDLGLRSGEKGVLTPHDYRALQAVDAEREAALHRRVRELETENERLRGEIAKR